MSTIHSNRATSLTPEQFLAGRTGVAVEVAS
jgi:hypothetical protein